MNRPAHVAVSSVVMICAATLCFAALDAVVKTLSQRHPVPVLVWARWSVATLFLLAWFAPRMRLALVRTARPGAQLARGGLMVASSVCFVTGLTYLPLADATALNYSTPVLVAVLAPAFLGERMTVPRAAFVFAGIVGMLMIVRPGSAVFSVGAVFALCAAGFYATYLIMTRVVAMDDYRVLLFYPTLVASLAATPFVVLLDADIAFGLQDSLMLLAGSAIGTLGHLLFLRAFQRGTATSLTPFTYTQLVWATAIGWLAFGTLPDRWTIAGMAVIAGSGLFMTYHEWRSGRAAQGGPPTQPATIE